MVVAWGWGREGRELVLMRTEFPFGKTRRFWRRTVVTIAQPHECT